LELSVKNFVSSQVEFLEFEVLDNVWTVNLPQYEFKSIGSYLVTILSIKDASHCVAASLDPLTSATWVDVSETAAISPLDHRKDYCVGDISHFQLEGTPAWQIG
jgi:nucleoporin POM152